MQEESVVIQLLFEAMTMMYVLSGPPVLVSAAIGFVVALLQTITKIQEQTVPVIIKIFVIFFILAMFGGAGGNLLYHFTLRCFESFPILSEGNL